MIPSSFNSPVLPTLWLEHCIAFFLNRSLGGNASFQGYAAIDFPYRVKGEIQLLLTLARN